jgi:hypothetical protein
MIKILKVYENITDFNDFQDSGHTIRVVYKDSEKPDDYFVNAGLWSMGPVDSNFPVKYPTLLGHKFPTLQHAMNDDYSESDDHFSVNAEDGLRFEILEFEKD